MVYFGTPDGRVNLLYPFAGHVLIGSTDIAQPDPDTARCSAEEQDYLCKAVETVFPAIPVTPDQIRHSFSGVRPLPRATGDVGAVTRDHSIATLTLPESTVPVHCLIGGKWTTFRAFSELATDRVLADLGLARQASTVGLAIGGGRDLPRDAAGRAKLAGTLARQGGISATRAEVLLSRYGTRAAAYTEGLQGRGEAMLATLPDFAREEIRHIATTERVGGIEDILHRRTLIGMTGRDTPAVRDEISALLDTERLRVTA
jgi:glycerol-3-phosphate dehydrogenase